MALKFQKGDEVKVQRHGFTHHGIVLEPEKLIIDLVCFGRAQGEEEREHETIKDNANGVTKAAGRAISSAASDALASLSSAASMASTAGSPASIMRASCSASSRASEAAFASWVMAHPGVKLILDAVNFSMQAGKVILDENGHLKPMDKIIQEVSRDKLAGMANDVGDRLGKMLAPMAWQVSAATSASASCPIGGFTGLALKMLIARVGPKVSEKIMRSLCSNLGEIIGSAIGNVLGRKVGEVYGKMVGAILGKDFCQALLRKHPLGEDSKAQHGQVSKEVLLEEGAKLAEEIWQDMLYCMTQQSDVTREVIALIFTKMESHWRRKGATGVIRVVSWEGFANKATIKLVERHEKIEDRNECLGRAQSKAFKPITYNVATANCQHFAKWCLHGKGFSWQVTAASTSVPTGVGVLGGAGLGAWAGVGMGSATLLGSQAAGAAAVSLGLLTAPFSWPIALGVAAGTTAVGAVAGLGTSVALNNINSGGGDFPTLDIDDFEYDDSSSK